MENKRFSLVDKTEMDIRSIRLVDQHYLIMVKINISIGKVLEKENLKRNSILKEFLLYYYYYYTNILIISIVCQGNTLYTFDDTTYGNR